jgi:hypothetical protein
MTTTISNRESWLTGDEPWEEIQAVAERLLNLAA